MTAEIERQRYCTYWAAILPILLETMQQAFAQLVVSMYDQSGGKLLLIDRVVNFKLTNNFLHTV
jgi:hypothetical protein